MHSLLKASILWLLCVGVLAEGPVTERIEKDVEKLEADINSMEGQAPKGGVYDDKAQECRSADGDDEAGVCSADTVETEPADTDAEKGTDGDEPETKDGGAGKAASGIKINTIKCDGLTIKPLPLTLCCQYKLQSNGKGSYLKRDVDKQVDLIVIHEGASAQKLVDSGRWKKQCISSHFAVERDGSVYQLMDLDYLGAHAGDNTYVNSRSIGIDLQSTSKMHPTRTCSQSFKIRGGADGEYKGETWKKFKERVKNKKKSPSKQEYARFRYDCTYSDALYKSLNTLVKCLAKQVPKITHDDKHIVAHKELKTSHADPRNFDFTRIGLTGSTANSAGDSYKYNTKGKPANFKLSSPRKAHGWYGTGYGLGKKSFTRAHQDGTKDAYPEGCLPAGPKAYAKEKRTLAAARRKARAAKKKAEAAKAAKKPAEK